MDFFKYLKNRWLYPRDWVCRLTHDGVSSSFTKSLNYHGILVLIIKKISCEYLEGITLCDLDAYDILIVSFFQSLDQYFLEGEFS